MASNGTHDVDERTVLEADAPLVLFIDDMLGEAPGRRPWGFEPSAEVWNGDSPDGGERQPIEAAAPLLLTDKWNGEAPTRRSWSFEPSPAEVLSDRCCKECLGTIGGEPCLGCDKLTNKCNRSCSCCTTLLSLKAVTKIQTKTEISKPSNLTLMERKMTEFVVFPLLVTNGVSSDESLEKVSDSDARPLEMGVSDSDARPLEMGVSDSDARTLEMGVGDSDARTLEMGVGDSDARPLVEKRTFAIATSKSDKVFDFVGFLLKEMANDAASSKEKHESTAQPLDDRFSVQSVLMETIAPTAGLREIRDFTAQPLNMEIGKSTAESEMGESTTRPLVEEKTVAMLTSEFKQVQEQIIDLTKLMERDIAEDSACPKEKLESTAQHDRSSVQSLLVETIAAAADLSVSTERPLGVESALQEEQLKVIEMLDIKFASQLQESACEVTTLETETTETSGPIMQTSLTPEELIAELAMVDLPSPSREESGTSKVIRTPQ